MHIKPELHVDVLRTSLPRYTSSLVPRPSITANTVEGLVKLLHRMTSGGRLEAIAGLVSLHCQVVT